MRRAATLSYIESLEPVLGLARESVREPGGLSDLGSRLKLLYAVSRWRCLRDHC